MDSLLKYTLYFLPFFLIWVFYVRHSVKKENKYIETRDAAISSGMTEPASLHPIVDFSRCIGCGSCVDACPEGEVLGVIHGKAELINPTYCIGHGACKTACPENAITLVFGTEKRGIDIPQVAPNFETNVAGLFIAGELGGMGLIRNAIEQGKQAMASIGELCSKEHDKAFDVVIVGSGPAGIAASLYAKQHNLRYATLEQDSLGGTVAHFPRGKIVMTAPVILPIVGKIKLTETTKEELLNLWEKIERDIKLDIHYHERVENVTPIENGFLVKTERKKYETRAVLLTIGRRGTPRKLGVPGEEQNKVVYRLTDPAQYRGLHVLVVGGGDSALEAAISIAEEPDTTVTISYRSKAFSRAKEKNRLKIEVMENNETLQVMLESNVKNITHNQVFLEHKGEKVNIENQAIIVCAGGILPTPFLKQIGIHVETKHGEI